MATRTLIAAGIVLACLMADAESARAGDAAFTRAPDIFLGPGSSAQSAAVGDFDANGKQDVAITNNSLGRLQVYLGNGDGTFSSTGTYDDLGGPRDVAVADFDADGTEDLAVTTSGAVRLFRGIGAGVFDEINAILVNSGGPLIALTAGDFNGDGRDDLAATGATQVIVRLGSGDGTFPSVNGTAITVGPGPRDIHAADLDGDGAEDLAVTFSAQSPRGLGGREGEGTGAFEPLEEVDVPNRASGLALGDFTGDARWDLAASIPAEDRVSVRPGIDGGFSDDPQDVPVGTQPGPMAVADFDLDGHEDLAVGSGSPNSGAVDVRLGRGDATFTDGGNVAVAGAPTSVVAGDFNADGRTDLVVPTASQTVSVRLGSGDPRRANLLVNGDFEQGVGARLPTQSPSIPGWLSASGMTFARYGIVPHLHYPTQLGAPRFGNGD
jgi:hypothetical protein